MRRLTDTAIDALASEYVLGTLRGRARRRLASMALADPRIAAGIARWHSAFAPLVEGIAPVAPPQRVWKAVEARIAPARGAPAPASRGSAFWRPFGMIAGGLAAVLLAVFVRLAPTPPAVEPQMVAVLTSPDSAPRMVVTMESPEIMRVRVVKPWGGIEGKALELWALPRDGAPRSLGLVANAGETMLRMAPGDARLAGANALAISLEPPGGSPTNAPTGPVLCSGVIAKA